MTEKTTPLPRPTTTTTLNFGSFGGTIDALETPKSLVRTPAGADLEQAAVQ